MKETVYRGSIHSVLPQKGYGFIKPDWAESSEDNIYFYLPDTKKGRKCFIPALGNAEARTETTNRNGVKIITPVEPQIVYFKLEEQLREGKPSKLIARDLTDDNHVSDDVRNSAEEASKVKPNLSEIEEEVVEVETAPETSKCDAEVEMINEVAAQDNLVVQAEEVALTDEEYDDDYEDYDEDESDYDEYEEWEDYQDQCDRQYAKSNRRYSPKDNRED